jgi:hypothetical protein
LAFPFRAEGAIIEPPKRGGIEMNLKLIGKLVGLGVGLVLVFFVSLSIKVQAFCISPPLGLGPCERTDNIHETITRQGLFYWFEESFLQEIIDGVWCRDVTEHTDLYCSDYGNNWGKDEDGWIEDYHPKYHFDNCAFVKGGDNLFRSFDNLIELIKKDDDASAKKARQYFGFLILHPAQDFYAHSNWIDLEAERLKNEGKELIIPNFDIWWDYEKDVIAKYKNGELISGLYRTDDPKVPNYCEWDKPAIIPYHEDLNKDKVGSNGDRSFQERYGISGFSVAFFLATKETRAWWDDIHSIICEQPKAEEMLEKFTGKHHSCGGSSTAIHKATKLPLLTLAGN